MFIKKDKQLEKNFNKKVQAHTKQVKNYLVNYSVPDIISYYIGTGYYKSCLFEDSFDIYINSIFDIFNYEFEITNELKKAIKKQLLIKFGLRVINENPLELKCV